MSLWGFSVGVPVVQNTLVNTPANVGDAGSIPGLGRSLGEGKGNPLQYSRLGNPMDRGAWQATDHRVAKESDTTEQLNNNNVLILEPYIYICVYVYIYIYFFFFLINLTGTRERLFFSSWCHVRFWLFALSFT